MRGEHKTTVARWWIAVPIVFTGLVLITHFALILYLNGGTFTYSLDDPYIHLALSEQLAQFHYGINAGENSAPSSSILWPFLLAPFSLIFIHEYVPLFLNSIATLISVRLLLLLFERMGMARWRHGPIYAAVIGCLFAFCLNLTGLVFTGMEHPVSVMLAMGVVVGLTIFLEDEALPWWFLASIVAGPLIRYENITLSIGAVAVLFLRNRPAHALGMAGALLATVGGFSLFLMSLGLPPMPSSVMIHSEVVSSSLGSKIGSIIENVATPFGEPVYQAWVLLALTCVMIVFTVVKRKDSSTVLLLLCGIFASLGHFVAGQFVGFARYEIYILTVAFAVVLYASRDVLAWLFARAPLVVALIAILLFARAATGRLIYATMHTPLGANNIYEQQYQMHRFITEYHKGPVAVNDLGWTAYRNPHYVLDLWGLGSEAARKARNSGNAHWNAKVVSERNIPLVIIYDNWFPDMIPEHWTKLAHLHLGRELITAAHEVVSFYGTPDSDLDRLRGLLHDFALTLPANVRLEMSVVGQRNKVTSEL